MVLGDGGSGTLTSLLCTFSRFVRSNVQEDLCERLSREVITVAYCLQ